MQRLWQLRGRMSLFGPEAVWLRPLAALAPDKKVDTTPWPRRHETRTRKCFQAVLPILKVRVWSSHASIAGAVKIHRAPWPVCEGGGLFSAHAGGGTHDDKAQPTRQATEVSRQDAKARRLFTTTAATGDWDSSSCPSWL